MASSCYRRVLLIGALLAGVAFADDSDGTTPLHYAARDGNVASVRSLLASGVKADAANRYGVTPLSLAVEAGNIPVMQTLIAAEADVNHALPEGETILPVVVRPVDTADVSRA